MDSIYTFHLSAEGIIFILLTLGCYGYDLVRHIENLSPNRQEKGQITQNMKLFNVLEFVNLVI